MAQTRTELPLVTTDCQPDEFQLAGEFKLTAGLDVDDAHHYAQIFKALGDPTRLRLISMVAAHDDHEACVCDLTEPLDLGQPTVSHHLKILVDAGLLRREKRGIWAYYSIVPDGLESAMSLLGTLPR